MDEEQNLEALSKLLTELSSNPYDLSLHVQHIKLTSLPGLEDEANSARQMMTGFWPAGDDIWVPLIDAKIKEGVDSVEAALEVLALFEAAENDYLSIPLLQKHMQFVVDRNAYFSSQTLDLGEEEYFTADWCRACMVGIVEKCAHHLTASHLLWDARRDWEMEQLEKTTEEEERTKLVLLVEDLYMERIKQCHSTIDETSTAYSTFTTAYKPAHLYEKLMLAGSKAKASAAKAYTRREPFEEKLIASNYSPEAYNNYIMYERKSRKVDFDVLSILYERAIADTAKRRFGDIENTEYALRAFWSGYCDAVRQYGENPESNLSVFKRAVRSVPGCGAIWANYIRFLEGSVQDSDLIADAYRQALESKLLKKNVEDIVAVVLARAGQLRRSIMVSEDVTSDVETLFKVLEDGVEMVRKAAPTGDVRYRLEKFTAKIYVNLADSPELAASLWAKTVKHYKTSYLAWMSHADALVDQGKIDEARAVFADAANKRLDWPEAIFDAWESFEHLHGTLENLQDCLQKIERAQQQVNTRRAKEAQRAAYQTAEVAVEMQAATVPVAEAVNVQETEPKTNGQPMEVDKVTREASKKRKHEEDDGTSSKKAKGDTSAPPKRDRENCTVFVANLPQDATEDDIAALFKSCGSVTETKVTDLPSTRVATVEFSDRESVPAALTRDKKRINGQEVSVHLAWRSTLYVTNFPEKADDKYIRGHFDKFGTIFDVRWPSKKFKSTRRFCYVQYTSPDSAEAALSLHGQELEAGHPLNVYISNPERKKERTDAGANDREIYIAGLSKFATTADLEKLFRTYGTVKDVRMITDEAGHSKGFAFVEFEDEATAQKALQANNHDLKNRRIAVTMADSRIRARRPDFATRIADIKSRSLRIRNLPEGTEEGLLQQALEKIARVKRVEIFKDIAQAVVELENVAEAGRLLLAQEPITFNEKVLAFSEEPQLKQRPPTDGSASMFVPRAAASRPRAGIGAGKKRQPAATGQMKAPQAPAPVASGSNSKGQDDFRKMLG